MRAYLCITAALAICLSAAEAKAQATRTLVSAVGDEKKGEKLVVLHTADDKQVQQAFDALGDKGLPNLFLPRRDQFFKVEAIPILGTGKLDLRAVKAKAQEFAQAATQSQPA